MTSSAHSRNTATVAPAPKPALSVNVNLEHNAVQLFHSDPTGVSSAKVTRMPEKLKHKRGKSLGGHHRSKSSAAPTHQLIIGNQVIKPIPTIDTARLVQTMASTPKSAGSLLSPRRRKTHTYEEHIQQVWQDCLRDNLPNLPNVPEDPNSHRNNGPHPFRSYQSTGTNTNPTAPSSPPMSIAPILMQTQSSVQNSLFDTTLFNPDGTPIRHSPLPFDASQSRAEDKEYQSVRSFKSFKSVTSLQSSVLNRARTHRDIEETNMDVLIRLTHCVNAVIEIYTLKNETVPDCLLGIRREMCRTDIADVTKQIAAIQKIATQGEDYLFTTRCSPLFNFFSRKNKSAGKPAAISQHAERLLDLLRQLSNNSTFIHDMNEHYETIMKVLKPLKAPPMTTTVINVAIKNEARVSIAIKK